MADINKFAPKVKVWEGGYVDDPADKGGATNMGVTLATWKQIGCDKDGDGYITKEDVKRLDHADFVKVLKVYWDKWQADKIVNQSIAEMLVDWVWASGAWGVIIPQRLLGVKSDGVAGPATLAAVNGTNHMDFFAKLLQARIKFVDDIVAADRTQKRFETGWKRRINSFAYADEPFVRHKTAVHEATA